METLLQQQDFDRAQQITQLYSLPPEPVALQQMRSMAQRQRGVTARRRNLLWRRIERELISRGCTENSVLGKFFEERFREIVAGGESAHSISVVGSLRDEDELNEIELLVALALARYQLRKEERKVSFSDFSLFLNSFLHFLCFVSSCDQIGGRFGCRTVLSLHSITSTFPRGNLALSSLPSYYGN